ncbi:MAG: FMN-binding negative transcriptional regulator [Paracoccus sp. (in: a-proteobacteria)]|nr:FMN-binding negative transcriptional regulator [Paracoccus sp. (in: a-proteobacteria)]
MYCPPAFAETRPGVMAALIRAHPLAMLITSGEAGPCANLIPFDLGADGVLRAHLARANPQLVDLAAGGPVLVVFQGPQAYISPDWYASKVEHGRVVPTWNFLMVQARGRAVLHEGADWLRDQCAALTDRMEAAMPAPWAVTDAPEKFVAAQMRGITGLEIHVTQMTGKWKASQNRTADDRAGVAQALRDTHPELAGLAAGET